VGLEVTLLRMWALFLPMAAARFLATMGRSHTNTDRSETLNASTPRYNSYADRGRVGSRRCDHQEGQQGARKPAGCALKPRGGYVIHSIQNTNVTCLTVACSKRRTAVLLRTKSAALEG
jgi:hypothetical protein